MTLFQSAVHDFMKDVFVFLSETLHAEVMSLSALTHKEHLLGHLSRLNSEYPQLQLTFLRVDRPPPSPLPYVDMNCGSPPTFARGEFGDHEEWITNLPSVGEDENYDDVGMRTRSSLHESEGADQVERRGHEVGSWDSNHFDKIGFLGKKKRDALKGWLNPFQKRWCALREGTLYYYDRQSDSKHKGSIPLIGYEARASGDARHCFELVCPGRRTYQFCAPSEEDMEEWIQAIERSCSTPMDQKVVDTAAAAVVVHQREPTREDTYEAVDEPDGSAWSDNFFDDRDWFVGLWDCSAEDDSELDFRRGDLIRIVSREYDHYAWWIGEHQGRVGFVPKSYLMRAYEMA